MLIDTHAHIYLKEFDGEYDSIVKKALDAGVTKILLPNIDQTTIEDLFQIEAQFPDVCHAMMGLHPCSVNADFQKDLKSRCEIPPQATFCELVGSYNLF